MKVIRYSPSEFSVLRSLLGKTVQRILCYNYHVILDFGTEYVQFDIKTASGVGKIGNLEVKYTIPTLHQESMVVEDSETTIARNFSIDQVDIMNTWIYQREKNKESVQPIKTTDENLNKVVAKLLTKAHVVTEELLIRPSTIRKLFYNTEYINAVDVGIRIRSGNNFLVIAPIDNKYGFMKPNGCLRMS